MPSTNWLTQEQLLDELRQSGIILVERTLRFWVSNGVLPAPAKKPFPGADGRVGYYPREALAAVPKILKLQEEGWKLRQIRERLRTPEKEKSRAPAGARGEEAEEWASRYLHDLLSDSEARDRRRCFSSPGAAISDLRQIRHYLVARLERIVGRGTAVRATSAFLLGLSQRDTKRLITRLKISSLARATSSSTIDEERPARILPTLEEAETTSAVADQIARVTSELEGVLGERSRPILARRTFTVLNAMSQVLMRRPRPEAAAELLKPLLASLAEIEREAAANLVFLERHPGSE